MSNFYNMIFGRNSQSALLLAVIGFKENDVERFRDVSSQDEGKRIAVYTRTGGGNREGYPQVALLASPLYVEDRDDDFDSTYATFYFKTPEEFVTDVEHLCDVLTHGIRPEFAQHLAKTLNREPTEGDKQRSAYDSEQAAIARTEHFMANGHTFVPKNDSAMQAALELAEKNGGELRSTWGILPLEITVKRDFKPWPNAKDPDTAANLTRIEIGYKWEIDEAYWKHCQERFTTRYPLTMAKIAEDAAEYRAKAS